MLDLVDNIVDQGLLFPHNIAVSDQGQEYSYNYLLSMARRFCSAIASVGEYPRVAILLPQSLNAYASMLGVLMAGGYYCPINVSLPKYRKKQILEEFQPQLIIGNSVELEDLDDISLLDARLLNIAEMPNDERKEVVNHHELAYVIFTSGSTGTPKGVMIRRSAVSHFINWAIAAIQVAPGDRWGQFCNLGFDLSVMDIFACLGGGGTLVPITRPRDRLMPALAIKKYQLTIWHSVPSVIDLMRQADHITPENLRTLRLISLCGEPLMPHHLDILFKTKPTLKVFNTYGPTETTVFCTYLPLNSENYKQYCGSSVSIGITIPGWRIDLFDDGTGAQGEIVISGPHIGEGYWGDLTLTNSKYSNLMIEGKSTRSYFTGDWAENIDGNLYFKNRIDRQVKIHGFRVELGEIDFFIREYGVINSCSIEIDHRIVSFLEGHDDIDLSRLQGYLSNRLPYYAIPSTFVVLERLPRNYNEKVDVTALKKLASS